MSIKSYVSKLYLAISISSNFSFIKFLINSKRYSNKFKSGTLDIKKEESIKYYFKFNGKKIDIMMRTFQGDIDIFYEIFWSRMYEVSEKYLSNPKIIVDLGAHIGFTSIYYGLNYPKAKIFSLEASKKNYSILAFNVKHFTNIKIFYKAVYTEDGVINFEDDGILSYNTKINKNGTPVGCISMNTFMEQNGIEKIDLLKTDIEGAESQIFKKENNWLSRVENIIIEIHTPYTVENLKEDLEPFGFEINIPNKENNMKNIFCQKRVKNITPPMGASLSPNL